MYQLSFTAQELEKLYKKQSTEIVREVSVSDDNFIVVNVNFSIADGTELKFKSPVDCSQIIGLRVWYKNGDGRAFYDFNLADARGNNVGDITHLFAENVVVSVILDVTSSMAFVQNAATNAYIERTFVKSVNGTTPDMNGNVEIVAGSGSSQCDWNNMLNKPFGEVSSTGGDTLYWDGNTDGKLVVEYEAVAMVKVSDAVLTLSDFSNGCIEAMSFGDVIERSAEEMQEVYDATGIIAGDGFIYAPDDNYNHGGYFVLPEKGIWFSSIPEVGYFASLTINGYTGFPVVKKIEEKYLPDTVATKDYVEQVILGGAW